MVFCTGGDSWWLDQGKKACSCMYPEQFAVISCWVPDVLAVLFRTLLTIPLLESALASPELILDALSKVVYSV